MNAHSSAITMLQWLEGPQTLITCSKDKSVKFWKLPPIWVDDVAANPDKVPQQDFYDNKKKPGDLTSGYKLTEAKEYYEKKEQNSSKPIGNIGHMLVSNNSSDDDQEKQRKI